jgi:hypothetical protein
LRFSGVIHQRRLGESGQIHATEPIGGPALMISIDRHTLDLH